jgi:hypothetical protein
VVNRFTAGHHRLDTHPTLVSAALVVALIFLHFHSCILTHDISDPMASCGERPTLPPLRSLRLPIPTLGQPTLPSIDEYFDAYNDHMVSPQNLVRNTILTSRNPSRIALKYISSLPESSLNYPLDARAFSTNTLPNPLTFDHCSPTCYLFANPPDIHTSKMASHSLLSGHCRRSRPLSASRHSIHIRFQLPKDERRCTISCRRCIEAHSSRPTSDCERS